MLLTKWLRAVFNRKVRVPLFEDEELIFEYVEEEKEKKKKKNIQCAEKKEKKEKKKKRKEKKRRKKKRRKKNYPKHIIRLGCTSSVSTVREYTRTSKFISSIDINVRVHSYENKRIFV